MFFNTSTQEEDHADGDRGCPKTFKPTSSLKIAKSRSRVLSAHRLKLSEQIVSLPSRFDSTLIVSLGRFVFVACSSSRCMYKDDDISVASASS